jgi:hypothetical protein
VLVDTLGVLLAVVVTAAVGGTAAPFPRNDRWLQL